MTEKSDMAESKQATVGNLGGASSVEESLSALMDDRASEMEVHRVLREVDSSPHLRATWSRYQMASNAMKGDMEAVGSLDLSAAISEAIDKEQTYSSSGAWMKSFGRFAVAASVAAVVVITTQLTDLGMQQPASLATNDQPMPSAVSLPAGFQAPSLSARTVSSHSRMSSNNVQRNYVAPQSVRQSQAVAAQPPSPEVQLYLMRVMELHATNASQNGNLGLIPYARIPAEPAQD